MRLAVAPIALAALALSGCGGGDEEAVEKTVREFIEATSKRDANKVCDELLTREFIEQSTGQTGGRAPAACKDQIKSLQRGDISLVKVDRPKIDGERARVRVTLEVQKRRQPQVFNLRKEDGDWRLAGGA